MVVDSCFAPPAGGSVSRVCRLSCSRDRDAMLRATLLRATMRRSFAGPLQPRACIQVPCRSLAKKGGKKKGGGNDHKGGKRSGKAKTY